LGINNSLGNFVFDFFFFAFVCVDLNRSLRQTQN